MLDIQAEYQTVCRVFARQFRRARRRGGAALFLNYEDVFQDFLLSLHRKQTEPSAYDPKRGDVGAYLTVVADTMIWKAKRDLFAKKRGRPVFGDEADAATWERPTSSEDSPEAVVGEEEELRPLRAALSLLPESERFVVEEHYFKGTTLLSLSKTLGVSVSRVHQRLDAGRAHLREALSSDEPE